MTGQTPKDVREDAEDVGAVESGEATPAEDTATAKAGTRPPAKRRRRVRVIEVLDDDDDLDTGLDEVLAAIDEQQDEDAEEERPKPAKAKPSITKAATKTAETTPAEEAKSRSRKEPVSLDGADEPTFLGMRRTPALVVIVLVAVLASLGVWQWRTAAGLSSEKDERAAVTEVAKAYGDLALNYNASNYQSQVRKVQALLGGDLLDSYKTNMLPTFGRTFQADPQVALTSKTDQVFVGGVDERFATATISVDVTLRTSQGTSNMPATLIRLTLAKIGGEWKITEQFASGVNEQNRGQQGALPTTAPSGGPGGNPSGNPSGSPSPAPSGSPSGGQSPRD
jgi:hypothetical protein